MADCTIEENIAAIRKLLEAQAKPLNYNINLFEMVQSDRISSDCAEVMFINLGASTVILNNSIPITPNTFISFNGNKGEIDKTIYTVTFTGAGANRCIVARKYYI